MRTRAQPRGDVIVEFDAERAAASAERLRAARRRVDPDPPVTMGRGWEPAQEAMARAAADPPDDIAGVLARLDTIQ